MAEQSPRILCTKPRGKVAKLLGNLGVEVEPYEAGEALKRCDRYILGPKAAADRKTGSGFGASIADKTLFVQAVDLAENFTVRALIVEGELFPEYSSFHPRAIYGALSSLPFQYGITVLQTKSPEETAEVLHIMAMHAQYGVPEISLHPKRKATELADQQRRIVEMFPGAGMVGARRLLQKFGSIPRLVAATEEELLEVPGFGKKKVKQLRAVLEAEYEAWDTEQDLEAALAARPELLFDEPADLIGRQLGFTDADGVKCVIDLAYMLRRERTIVLVELKREAPRAEHLRQLQMYLDGAHSQPIVRGLLEEGYALRGILASPVAGRVKSREPRIEIKVLAEAKIVEELVRQRHKRLRARTRQRKR